MFRRLLSRLTATLFGLTCDVCGRRGASLTIEAIPTAREERDDGRVILRTFAVRSARSLCPHCRNRT
jgi:hypothetical protein